MPYHFVNIRTGASTYGGTPEEAVRRVNSAAVVGVFGISRTAKGTGYNRAEVSENGVPIGLVYEAPEGCPHERLNPEKTECLTCGLKDNRAS